MFINTIAVGPFEEVESWVTGGATVAIDRPKGFCCRKQVFLDETVDLMANFSLETTDEGLVIYAIEACEVILGGNFQCKISALSKIPKGLGVRVKKK